MEKFNRKTHGLGILFMIMMGFFLVMGGMQIIQNYQNQNAPPKLQKYEIIIKDCEPHCYQYA
jgi:hypothetical protein